MENERNELMVKEVDFNGGQLLGVQSEDGRVWLGIRQACRDIGLTDDQAKRQTKNIQKDLVLSKGVSNLTHLTNGGHQDILAIELDFIPLWLAKISITPTMQQEFPHVVERLVDYQLKAKDVLAKAFVNKVEIDKLLLENLSDKATKYDELMDSKDMTDMLKFAHILNVEGMGRNKLFNYLRQNKILMKINNRKNCPYEKYKNYFRVVESVSPKGHITYKTLITTHGQDFILNMLIKDGYVNKEYKANVLEELKEVKAS